MTRIFSRHLFDHDFGIGKDMQCSRTEIQSELQRFEKRCVLGHVVVLVADPLRDPNLLTLGILDDDTDPRWSWTAMRAAVNVGNKF